MAFGNRTTQLFPYLAFPVILGLILIGFQMVPLSQGIAKVVAPKQAELYEKFASPVDGELLPEANPASVAPRITMDADGTARMFNLMILVLISLVLGSHFFSSRRAIFILPFFVTINGMAISLYGMVQRLSSSTSIYGIEIDLVRQPFGPFVNKNNAAGFLLICMAGSLMLLFGVFFRKSASGQRPKPIITSEYPIWRQISLHIGVFLAELNAAKLAAILATATIGMGVLFTFSRGGILAMGTGMAMAATWFCMIRKSSFLLLGVLCVGMLVVGLLGFLGVGDQLASRLGTISNAELLTTDKRINHWVQTAPAIGDFNPFGSGVGSYLNVHRLYRVDSELRVFYFAENQYFQTLVEAGFIGLILLLTAILLLALSVRFISNRGNSPKTSAICIMGVFLIPSQMVVAFFDFGLFIPANAILMAVSCGFIAGQAHALADRLKKKNVFQYNIPRIIALTLLLAVFTVSLFSLISCQRYAQVERAMGQHPQNENYVSMNLKATEQRIDNLKTAITKLPDANGLVRLSELYLYRYRIQLFEALVGEDAVADSMDSKALDRKWISTGVDRLHNMVYQAWDSGSQRRVNDLITDPLVSDNVLPAVYYLKMSRSRSPLKPSVHLLLAQLHGVSPTRDADVFHLQRTQELAPANSVTALICGILNLQAGRLDPACKNLKKCLQIDRKNYKHVVSVSVPFLPAQRIVDEILPDDPLVLYTFANRYMASKSMEPVKFDVFRRVINLLDEAPQWDRRSLGIKAEIQEELSDYEGAIKTRQLAVDLNPSVLALRYKLARLMIKNGDLDDAAVIARYLIRNDKNNKSFMKLYKRTRELVEQRNLSR